MPELISNTTVAVSGSVVVGMFAALGKWLLGREVNRLDKAIDTHGAAIDQLKTDHVGQVDIERMADKFEQTMVRLGDKLESKLDAVHRRIDQFQGLPPRE